MTIPEELQAAALTAVALGWLGKLIWELLHRDRKSIDKADTDQQKQAESLRAQFETMRTDLEGVKRQTAVLEDRIQALPDFERWDDKLEKLRVEQSAKLDKISDQLTDALVQIARMAGSQV